MGKRYDLSSLSFLVIDDNNYMLSIIKTLLKGYGVHRIYEASDAAEAFEEFQNSQMDVIIVDYALETLDGIEFSHLVRTANDSPNPYVPIIMLTAHSERQKVEEARDAGITEFLRKPICASDLYRRIIEVIERPRPFVRSKAYFGPDRRRRVDENYRGEERRKGSIKADEGQVDIDETAEITTDACA
jgi:CheY-like chemotaxis protein